MLLPVSIAWPQLPELRGALATRKQLLHSLACLFTDVSVGGVASTASDDYAQLAEAAARASDLELRSATQSAADIRQWDFDRAVSDFVRSSHRHGVAELERRVRLVLLRLKVGRQSSSHFFFPHTYCFSGAASRGTCSLCA